MFPSIRTEGSSGWFGCWLTIQLLSQPFSFTTWRFTLENPFSSCWKHVEMGGGNGLRVLVGASYLTIGKHGKAKRSFCLLESSDMICTPKKARKWEEEWRGHPNTCRSTHITPLFGISGRGATSKSLSADVPRAGILSVFWIQQVGHKEGNHVTWEMG